MAARPSSLRVGALQGDVHGNEGMDPGSVVIAAADSTADPTPMPAQALHNVGPLGTVPMRAEPGRLPAPAAPEAPAPSPP